MAKLQVLTLMTNVMIIGYVRAESREIDVTVHSSLQLASSIPYDG